MREREYEEGPGDAYTLSGRTRSRIWGATKLSLGVTLTLSGGGLVAGVLGADFMQAGMRQGGTGNESSTVIRGGTALASEAFFAQSARDAQVHGDMAEILVPVVFGAWQVGSHVGRGPAAAATTDAVTGTRFLGGKPYGEARLATLQSHLESRGVNLHVGPDAAGVERAAFVVPQTGRPTMFLPAKPTDYVVTHELAHYVHFRGIGREAYRALPRSLTWNRPEQAVFDMLEHPLRWRRFNPAERAHASAYIERIGGFR
jgi:hypothetical protein